MGAAATGSNGGGEAAYGEGGRTEREARGLYEGEADTIAGEQEGVFASGKLRCGPTTYRWRTLLAARHWYVLYHWRTHIPVRQQ